jgi:hypothetical protein
MSKIISAPRLRDASEPARLRCCESGGHCAGHSRYDRERKLSRVRRVTPTAHPDGSSLTYAIYPASMQLEQRR